MHHYHAFSLQCLWSSLIGPCATSLPISPGFTLFELLQVLATPQYLQAFAHSVPFEMPFTSPAACTSSLPSILRLSHVFPKGTFSKTPKPS